MRRAFITWAAILAVGVGVLWYWGQGAAEGPQMAQSGEQEFSGAVSVETGEAVEQPTPILHPRGVELGGSGMVGQAVSLPALAAKEFDGRDLTVGRVLADNASYTRHFITYMSGDFQISGIMNVPKGDGPWPVLVLNHGYIDPAVYTNGRGLKREQDYLARRGYVVIHPDYRNHAQSDKDPENDRTLRLGYTEDVINAVLAARESGLAYIDGERVGMLGHSMGGGIAQNILVTKPELVDAVVLFAPVSADMRDSFERWIRERPEAAHILEQFGEPLSNTTFWDGVSAATYLDEVSSPVMLHHGTLDADVPLEWSEELVAGLEERDKDVEFLVYPGEPHEFIDAWPVVMERTVTFFDRWLKE